MFACFGSELLLYIVNVSSFPAISWGRLNLYTYNFIIYFTCIVSLYTVTIQDWSLTGLSDVIYIYIYLYILQLEFQLLRREGLIYCVCPHHYPDSICMSWFFFLFNDLKEYISLRFAGIGGIIDHHSLNFLLQCRW